MEKLQSLTQATALPTWSNTILQIFVLTQTDQDYTVTAENLIGLGMSQQENLISLGMSQWENLENNTVCVFLQQLVHNN